MINRKFEYILAIHMLWFSMLNRMKGLWVRGRLDGQHTFIYRHLQPISEFISVLYFCWCVSQDAFRLTVSLYIYFVLTLAVEKFTPVIFFTFLSKENGQHFANDILDAFSWQKISLSMIPSPLNFIPASQINRGQILF